MEIQKVNFAGGVKKLNNTSKKQSIQNTATKPYANDSIEISTKKTGNKVKLQAASLLMAAAALLSASGCSAQDINKYQSISSSCSVMQDVDSETGYTNTYYYKDGQLVKKESEGYENLGSFNGRDIILYAKNIEEYENGELTQKTRYYGENKDDLRHKRVEKYENGKLAEAHEYYMQNDGNWAEILICNE